MQNKELYIQIERAIRSYATTTVVDKVTAETDVYMAVRDVMRNNPDIFWFSHQWKYDEAEHSVRFFYTISKEKWEKLTAQIKDVVEKDFRLDYVRNLNVEQQLMYVYKWIAIYCKYNPYAAYNQTICSVFVYRNSVCTGYAKAAQYLLRLLGIESYLVFGKMHKSSKNSRHCWLVVNVKGKWYHFDPTFAEPNIQNMLVNAGVTPIIGTNGLVYNFFCTNTKTIKASRTIEDESAMPNCLSQIDYKGLQKLEIAQSRDVGCLISDVGSTSEVYLYHETCGKQLVVKMFKPEYRNTFFQHEASIAQELSGCPHILQAEQIAIDDSCIAIEQATLLSNLLCCHYYRLTVKEFCDLLLDVLSGINECLDQKIFYRDIHINNIYRDGNGTYKLGDYGSCCHVWEKARNRDGIGSEWYMSPETYRDGSFDEYSATYGVGMVAYFLLNNMYPPLWTEYEKLSLQLRVHGRSVPSPLRLKDAKTKVEKMLDDILRRALAFDKTHRMSINPHCSHISCNFLIFCERFFF